MDSVESTYLFTLTFLRPIPELYLLKNLLDKYTILYSKDSPKKNEVI
jgi:hypothetical protein